MSFSIFNLATGRKVSSGTREAKVRIPPLRQCLTLAAILFPHMKKQGHRRLIIHQYALWTALSGTRSGSPLKSRKDIYSLLEIVDFPRVLDKRINKSQFDKWHKENSELLKKKAPKMSIGWTTKIMNLYLKTAVYVGNIGSPSLSEYIHPPIDTGLWKGVYEHYSGDKEIIELTHSRTKIKDIRNYTEYLRIIDGLGKIARAEKIKLIEVEHLWQGTVY